MEVEEPPNKLLSNSKSSDSRLQVQLHPLVILTISDYITRHILRKQPGPIVGAILGTQNGRDITMEHAFDCKLDTDKNGQDIIIDAGWFHDRLQQYKDVHKVPALDLVGWFTLAPPSGPQPEHIPIHQQILENHNESALLLTFHPSSVAHNESRGGKLPVVIYETVYEAASADDDEQMQATGDTSTKLSLKLQELPYTIETGEAEMIAVDFVARGSGSARAINGDAAFDTPDPASTVSMEKGKTKASQANGSEGHGSESTNEPLPPEDEELIASLTAKSNAVQMLQERIRLMKLYLTSLPSCYLNGHQADSSDLVQMSADDRISYPVLRQINSMLARLPLLTPISASAKAETPSPQLQNGRNTTLISPHEHDRQTQQTDTQLITLLSQLGNTLNTASGLGRKFQVYEAARNLGMQGQRRGGGGGQMPAGFDQTGFGDSAFPPVAGSSGTAKPFRSNGPAIGGVPVSSLLSSWGVSGEGGHGEFADDSLGGDMDEDMSQDEWDDMNNNA